MNQPPPTIASPATPFAAARRIGVLLLGFAFLLAPAIFAPPLGLSSTAWKTAAIALTMALWWASEAIPLAATALLPIVLFPALKIIPLDKVSHAYANPLVFLFMGGFMLALAVERWGLHKRIAVLVLARISARPPAVLAGFMAVSWGLSMWISNTATAVMMLPIALSVIRVITPDERSRSPRPLPAFRDTVPEERRRHFAQALLLGTAYGCSIGGIATLVGTPPNAFFAAFMAERYAISIGFAQWMAFALPLSLALLIMTWILLSRFIYRLHELDITAATDVIARERASLGRISGPEKSVLVLFVVTALFWITRPLINQLTSVFSLSDAGIAITAGLCLFLIPARLKEGGGLLDWPTARRLPWGILILFGGGLALADAVAASGLAVWIGEALHGLAVFPPLILGVLLTSVTVFLTELTSNTATTATFLPIIASLGENLGIAPMVLALPVVIGASCAFMMPVATPPNAVVFASGHLRIWDMARAGILVNLGAILLISGYTAIFARAFLVTWN
ncbi:SLC13 family permease [Varunaivibrio sulfuroxidans]|nr:DASS family sodium-coupled anion symporter [Varunaivibrio sulfuroxidans]WES30515.1 DASS family sodium-coupled anion symporter [Varunaivibrio sulfuroxidans]